jgi:hypothetical protein
MVSLPDCPGIRLPHGTSGQLSFLLNGNSFKLLRSLYWGVPSLWKGRGSAVTPQSVRYGIFTTVTMTNAVFWHVRLCENLQEPHGVTFQKTAFFTPQSLVVLITMLCYLIWDSGFRIYISQQEGSPVITLATVFFLDYQSVHLSSS